MVMGDVPFSNEVEIVRAELNFSDDVSKGGLFANHVFRFFPLLSSKIKGEKWGPLEVEQGVVESCYLLLDGYLPLTKCPEIVVET